MTITLTEFRKNTKKYFDMALNHEPVVVERGGVHYVITAHLSIPPSPVAYEISHSDATRVKRASTHTVELKDPVKPVYTKAPREIAASLRSASPAVNLCKIHGIPLTTMGKCLMKGCKYA